MSRDAIITKIRELSDPERAVFQKRISKTVYEVCGVRVPDIRKLAKELNREGIELEIPENPLYEELLLYGFRLAYLKEPFTERIKEIAEYLERIDSWALCDSFCCSFKISVKEREEALQAVLEFLDSENPFYQRFGLVMILSHFLKLGREGKLKRPKVLGMGQLSDQDGLYRDLVMEILKRDFRDSQSSVAAGWLGAEAFLFYPRSILNLLEDDLLFEDVRKNLIKKIIESNIPDREVKDLVRKYRR